MSAEAKPRKTKVLGVPMLPDLRKRFEAQAALEGRKLAGMARFAIEYYLKAKQCPAHERDEAANDSEVPIFRKEDEQ